MIISKFDFKSSSFIQLNTSELSEVYGGSTDIAYDLGTLLRYAAYCVANDFTGQVLTIYQWAKQNGYQ
jgi:hypothetical protein